MGRDFAFIPLGGCGDSSFLEGHSYTYEGSTYGQIIQHIIQAKSMNLIFYFDELDKVSDSARGQEIIGILTHLMDSTQNNEFHDKYFSEISFDLSQCIFFVSYNDEKLVNPILLDRFHKIRTQAYIAKEKQVIAKKYLIPEICREIQFSSENIIVPDETILSIIDTYTNKEEGVRNLKRCLETIFTKINLFRLMNPTGLLETYLPFHRKITFPFTLYKNDIEFFLKNENNFSARDMMYA
jgi:ATP-dependent Lon protease